MTEEKKTEQTQKEVKKEAKKPGRPPKKKEENVTLVSARENEMYSSINRCVKKLSSATITDIVALKQNKEKLDSLKSLKAALHQFAEIAGVKL